MDPIAEPGAQHKLAVADLMGQLDEERSPRKEASSRAMREEREEEFRLSQEAATHKAAEAVQVVLASVETARLRVDASLDAIRPIGEREYPPTVRGKPAKGKKKAPAKEATPPATPRRGTRGPADLSEDKVRQSLADALRVLVDVQASFSIRSMIYYHIWT